MHGCVKQKIKCVWFETCYVDCRVEYYIVYSIQSPGDELMKHRKYVPNCLRTRRGLFGWIPDKNILLWEYATFCMRGICQGGDLGQLLLLNHNWFGEIISKASNAAAAVLPAAHAAYIWRILRHFRLRSFGFYSAYNQRANTFCFIKFNSGLGLILWYHFRKTLLGKHYVTPQTFESQSC